jgi:hypothetical protein
MSDLPLVIDPADLEGGKIRNERAIGGVRVGGIELLRLNRHVTEVYGVGA